jgi:histidine kinase/GAF domain-containing protein
VATVGADLESPSGFALRTGKPVISNHLENEQRFRTPELLLEHGIRRAMNVILQGDGSPYGVDSQSEGEFSEHDIAFLQGAANILGMALERQRYEYRIKTALDRHQILLKEISHRVKNSLQIVSSMLHLQASTADDEDLIAQQLSEASSRVSAIGRAYERLAYDEDFGNIDLGTYLQAVCADAVSTGSNCKLHFDGMRGIWLSADRAISLALIVNELVTNAVKYAFSNRPAARWPRDSSTTPTPRNAKRPACAALCKPRPMVLAVMPNSVARLVFPAVVVVLGKVRAADLLQMVVFGEIGSDQEDGCEGKPGKQNESDHHKLHRLMGRG